MSNLHTTMTNSLIFLDLKILNRLDSDNRQYYIYFQNYLYSFIDLCLNKINLKK